MDTRKPPRQQSRKASSVTRDRASNLRERLAYEAARMMVEQGIADLDWARRKAVERTGILDRRNWPSNEAIQEAVLTQRRLFMGTAHARANLSLRREAARAMRLLESFAPRLVGSALTGIGDRQAGVELFLFADRPEDVLFTLIERRIPWEEDERGFRYASGQRCVHPAFRFMAGDTPFELIVLPPAARRHPPLDPLNEKPWRGASLAEVERMLEHMDPDYRFEIGK